MHLYMHRTGWFAFHVDIAFPLFLSELKAATVAFTVTVVRTGVNVGDGSVSCNRNGNIARDIDVRFPACRCWQSWKKGNITPHGFRHFSNLSAPPHCWKGLIIGTNFVRCKAFPATTSSELSLACFFFNYGEEQECKQNSRKSVHRRRSHLCTQDRLACTLRWDYNIFPLDWTQSCSSWWCCHNVRSRCNCCWWRQVVWSPCQQHPRSFWCTVSGMLKGRQCYVWWGGGGLTWHNDVRPPGWSGSARGPF